MDNRITVIADLENIDVEDLTHAKGLTDDLNDLIQKGKIRVEFDEKTGEPRLHPVV